MIKHIDITATQKNYTIDADMNKYIQKKIGKLDKHLKKSVRSEARADVKLRENSAKGDKKCTCEVILHIPGTKITASESTSNMYAAVDIVEQKLQNQLTKYKEKQSANTNKQKSRARKSLSKLFSREGA